MNAPNPASEATRMEALNEYKVLDTLPEQAYDDIAYLASYICKTPVAMISLVDNHRQWFKSKVGTDLTGSSRDVAFCAHAILTPGDVMVVPDAHKDPRFMTSPLVTGDPLVRFYAGAPLVAPNGEAVGTLCVVDHVPRELSSDEADALRALSRQVVTQFELRKSVARLEGTILDQQEYNRKLEGYQRDLEQTNLTLESQSCTDGLTGVQNRHAFSDRLEEEIARAVRFKAGLSLLILDVDGFKSYNDEYGHPAGDVALQTVARLLQQQARAHDFIARYGGEEFAVILPNTSAEGALVLGERFRRAMQAAAWQGRSLTISIGVATVGDEPSSGESLIKSADENLYRAKQQGRNRVVHAKSVS